MWVGKAVVFLLASVFLLSFAFLVDCLKSLKGLGWINAAVTLRLVLLFSLSDSISFVLLF